MLKLTRVILALVIILMLVVIGYFGINKLKSSADTVAGTSTISVSPSSGSYKINDPITVAVNLAGTKQSSVIAIDVSYSSNLTYTGFDGANSVYTASIKDPATSGNPIHFERAQFAAPFPSSGLVGKLTFKATAAGTATVTVNKANTQVIEAQGTQQNILGGVTNGSFTVNAPTACFKIKLGNHKNASNVYDNKYTSITVTIADANNAVVKTATLPSSTDGTISLTDITGLTNSSAYTVKIKPNGYLARKITVTNILTSCTTLPDTKQFVEGDFDNTNDLGLADIGKAIYGHNGNSDTLLNQVYPVTFGTPSLADLGRLIYNYNNNKQGE